MAYIKKPEEISIDKYNQYNNSSEVFYGLPKEIIFCSNCAFSNQKPNSEKEFKHKINTEKPTVQMDKNNVCSACLVTKNKKKIDWSERKKQLLDLCNRYRSKDGKYDCLVPGSGGKDSWYAAHKLKYEYGMHPLTITWSPVIYTDWGWLNFQSWIKSGFDNYLFTPNGKTHRLLTRIALEKLFHPFQPFIMGQMYYPPKIASLMKIPLVFYGENPTEYGNNLDEDQTAQKKLSYYSSSEIDDIYISGVAVKELKNIFKLSSADLNPYLPPDPNQLKEDKIDVQYLGYYLPWHPQECYYYAVENGGFQSAPERSTGSFSKYSSIDDKIDDFHFYTTFIKFGIGRATLEASQEIRSGDITREEAIALIKRFDGEFPERFSKEIFEYLSINKQEFGEISKTFENPIMDLDYFLKLTNTFRSPHIWKIENGKWKLRNTIY